MWAGYAADGIIRADGGLGLGDGLPETVAQDQVHRGVLALVPDHLQARDLQRDLRAAGSPSSPKRSMPGSVMNAFCWPLPTSAMLKPPALTSVAVPPASPGWKVVL